MCRCSRPFETRSVLWLYIGSPEDVASTTAFAFPLAALEKLPITFIHMNFEKCSGCYFSDRVEVVSKPKRSCVLFCF